MAHPDPPRRPPVRRRHLAVSFLLATGLVVGLALVSPPCVPEPVPRISGRAGPLEILPELSIEEGRDAAHRAATGAAAGQAGRPRPPEPREDAQRPTPPVGAPVPGTTAPTPTPDQRGDTAPGPVVPLRPPAVSSPCFRLERMVPPEYPPLAEALPGTVHVTVAFFVDPGGEVTAAYTLESDGPPAYEARVLEAVRRWRYAPVPEDCDATDGFWQPLRVTFPPLLPVAGRH